MNYYEILQVSETASSEVIHMAYKALLKKYHPDLNAGYRELAEKQTQLLNEAYETLSNTEKRRQYDEHLLHLTIKEDIAGIEYVISFWKAMDKNKSAEVRNAIKDSEIALIIEKVKSANAKIKASKAPPDLISEVREDIRFIGREAAAYAHNDRGETEAAIRIIKALLVEFADIQEAADKLRSELHFLEEQLAKKNAPPPPSPSRRYTPRRKPFNAGLFWIFLIILVGAFISASISKSGEENPDADLTPVAEPRSGEILLGTEVYGGSEIKITASKGSSCVVRLKSRHGATRLAFYVRAGETVTVGVPAEYLYVYFASGDTWYGMEHLFGEQTSYSKDKTVCDFTQGSWQYTLYPVTNGNFKETPINEDEFKS